MAGAGLGMSVWEEGSLLGLVSILDFNGINLPYTTTKEMFDKSLFS